MSSTSDAPRTIPASDVAAAIAAEQLTGECEPFLHEFVSESMDNFVLICSSLVEATKSSIAKRLGVEVPCLCSDPACTETNGPNCGFAKAAKAAQMFAATTEDPAAPWTRDDEETAAIMSLAGESAPIERIATWTDEECQAVEQYCVAMHIMASDNPDYEVPERPACLDREVTHVQV